MTLDSGCKYIKYFFAAVFTFIILSAGGLSVFTGNQKADFSVTTTVHAQEETTYTFMQNVDLPGFGGDDGTITVSDQSFATYINGLIQVAIGFAILLSVIMVIAGGAEFMFAKSVTNKSDAQERIGKAIGGLILALSAVVILQTINPNLIELDPLTEVNVEGDEVTGVTGVTWDVKNPDNGYYACFKEFSGVNELYCYTDINKCSSNFDKAQESSDWSVNESNSCKQFVFYEGAQEEVNNASACYAYSSGGTNSISCFSDPNQCTNQKEAVEDTGTIILQSCQPPSDFGTGDEDLTYESSGTVVDPDGNNLQQVAGTSTDSDIVANQKCLNEGNEWIQNNTGSDEECPVSNSPQSPECTIEGCPTDSGNNQFTQAENELFGEIKNTGIAIKSQLNASGISIKSNWPCNNIGQSNCTSIGKIGGNAVDGLETIASECTDCNGLTVTGGSEWWLHSDGTEHKPGVGDDTVDLRPKEPLNNLIYDQGVAQSDDASIPCEDFGSSIYYINSGQKSGCYHRENTGTPSDHWHIEFSD